MENPYEKLYRCLCKRSLNISKHAISKHAIDYNS